MKLWWWVEQEFYCHWISRVVPGYGLAPRSIPFVQIFDYKNRERKNFSWSCSVERHTFFWTIKSWESELSTTSSNWKRSFLGRQRTILNSLGINQDEAEVMLRSVYLKFHIALLDFRVGNIWVQTLVLVSLAFLYIFLVISWKSFIFAFIQVTLSHCRTHRNLRFNQRLKCYCLTIASISCRLVFLFQQFFQSFYCRALLFL